MKNIVFVEQEVAGRGGRYSYMEVRSFDAFIKGEVKKDRNTVRMAYIDGDSRAMCNVSLAEFEEVFSKEDISTMQANGVLDYHPDEQYWVHLKYPMFQSSIYKKHGIQK